MATITRKAPTFTAQPKRKSLIERRRERIIVTTKEGTTKTFARDFSKKGSPFVKIDEIDLPSTKRRSAGRTAVSVQVSEGVAAQYDRGLPQYAMEGNQPVAQLSPGAYAASIAVPQRDVSKLYEEDYKRQHPIKGGFLTLTDKYWGAEAWAVGKLVDTFPKSYARLTTKQEELREFGLTQESKADILEYAPSHGFVSRTPSDLPWFKRLSSYTAGTSAGYIHEFQSQPIKMTAIFSATAVIGATSPFIATSPAASAIVSSIPVKVAGLGLAGAYVGYKGYLTYKAPSYYAKGEVLGETLAETTTAITGFHTGKKVGIQLVKFRAGYIPKDTLGVKFKDTPERISRKHLLEFEGKKIDIWHVSDDPKFAKSISKGKPVPIKGSLPNQRAGYRPDYLYYAPPEYGSGKEQAFIQFGGGGGADYSFSIGKGGTPFLVGSKGQYISAIPPSIAKKGLPAMVKWANPQGGKVFVGLENVAGLSTESQVEAIPGGFIHLQSTPKFTIYNGQIYNIFNTKIIEAGALPSIAATSPKFAYGSSSSFGSRSIDITSPYKYLVSAPKFSSPTYSSPTYYRSSMVSSKISSSTGSSPSSARVVSSSISSSLGSSRSGVSSRISPYSSSPISRSPISSSPISSRPSRGYSSGYTPTTPRIPIYFDLPKMGVGEKVPFPSRVSFQTDYTPSLFGIRSGRTFTSIPKDITGLGFRYPIRKKKKKREGYGIF